MQRFEARTLIDAIEIKIAASIEDGSADTTVTAGGQSKQETIEVKAGTVLLENNIFSQMIPIGRRVLAGSEDEATIPCFAPAAMRVLDMRALKKGKVDLKAGDKVLKVDWVLVQVGPVAISTYIDAEGRVVLINNPLQGFRASLKGYEDYKPVRRTQSLPLPDGVVEAEVRFKSGALMLVGTLTRPKGADRVPVVVLISGSGPQDRDANLSVKTDDPERGFLAGALPSWDIFKQVAYAISSKGIAVLRYDERGCGESEGTFDTATLTDFTVDVESAMAYLRTRDDIDPDRIGLVGHSEGAIIAPIIAAKEAQRVRAVFLMAAAARPLDEVVLQQSEAQARTVGLTEKQRARQREVIEGFFERVRNAEGDTITYKGREMFVGWWKQHLAHDPLKTIDRVGGAVCIYQGGKDLQVLPDHAETLEARMKKAGKTAMKVRTFASLDHLFMKSSGLIAEYADPERTVDTKFLRLLSRDVKHFLGRR